MTAKLDRFTRILDWNLLKYFIQIARSGGIGAGASALHISQPSASAALRKLEEQLGTRLFVRTRKGVELTAAGAFLKAECEALVGSIESVPQSLRAITGSVAGTVLVKSISHVFSPALDAGIIAFKNRYPEVELILETAPWEDILTSLISGDSAVAIGFDEVNRTELRHALLTREKMQIYCGPSHHLHGKRIGDPAELADEPFIAFSDGEPPAWRSFRERHQIGRKISGNADNVYEAWWLIGLGIGIGMLPEPTAAAMAMGQRLFALLPERDMPELDIYLMWRPDLQDRAAQLLIEIILEQIGLVE
ncbi:MAG: LysR family transcriptional regulator [Sphingomonas sp.]|nr:LysR family transcriptional regulator [Sphingomonas sp.]